MNCFKTRILLEGFILISILYCSSLLLNLPSWQSLLLRMGQKASVPTLNLQIHILTCSSKRHRHKWQRLGDHAQVLRTICKKVKSLDFSQALEQQIWIRLKCLCLVCHRLSFLVYRCFWSSKSLKNRQCPPSQSLQSQTTCSLQGFSYAKKHLK